IPLTQAEIKELLIQIYKELLGRKNLLVEEKQQEEIIKEEKKAEEKEEKKEEKEEKKEEKVEEKTITYCSYNSSVPLRNSLIINEVAWMGTAVSSADEWIEIRNISNKTVNLKGYQLIDKENQIQVVFDDISINSNGYLLLERTDDDSVPNIKADVIYKGSLGNTNEALYLFNDECFLLDSVETISGWPAGDNTLKKSMERKPDLSWQTYSGDSFGTPKANNSEQSVVIILPGGGGQTPPEATYCSQESLGSATHTPVIINEVSWMGSYEATDEWIELKNITSADVSLSGYQLLDKDNQIKVVFEASDVILANSYYLLERDDNEAVPLASADKIYTGILGNTSESLRLFNGECALVDEVVSEGDWPFGDNTLKKSMERKPDLSWQTYSGDSFGTPKASNSV
ncbi:MAG: lamin tail domain-containing protein, partial [Candidatus Pacebacteria bacterium]|nr:lamin tail domain-containing protein [Candidatus Paceibacterota bacterium]